MPRMPSVYKHVAHEALPDFFKSLTSEQARHLLESALSTKSEGELMLDDMIRDLLKGNGFMSTPDTLFRKLILEYGWGPTEAGILYYAAVRTIIGR